MQLTATITDNYLTMIEMLSGIVKRHLAKPSKKPARAQIDDRTFLLVSEALEQEDDEQTDFELTAELLGTQEFRRIA
ncbi:hypothetical protein ACX1C1_07070 [Paenibacillus sp. strain BS8-2]